MFKSLELQLIAQVRKYNDLYDKKCRDFELKEQHWQQIGDVIGISPLTAKRRWTSLKNRYLRIRKNPKSSNEWQFFNFLCFLDPFYAVEYERKEDKIQEQQPEVLFEPHLKAIPEHIRKSITNSEPRLEEIQKNATTYKSCLQEIPGHTRNTNASSVPLLEENLPIRKSVRTFKPRDLDFPKQVDRPIRNPRIKKNPQSSRKTNRSTKRRRPELFESRFEEIPQRFRKTYSNCRPRQQNPKTITGTEEVIIKENASGSEPKTSHDEICEYELKLSNEDNYTYELKINNARPCRPGLENIQNRVYELSKVSKGCILYGTQNRDDCDSFGQFIAAKLRILQSEVERNAMKQKILQAINYLPEQAEDGILDIVFIEGDEAED